METTNSPIEAQQTAAEPSAAPVVATPPEAGQSPQTPAAPAQGIEAPGKLEADGIALDDDGELQFGDKFFDAYREDFGAPQGGQELGRRRTLPMWRLRLRSTRWTS